MNVKPISDFLCKIEVSVNIDSNAYKFSMSPYDSIDDEIRLIFAKETDLESRKKALATLYLYNVSKSDLYKNLVSCITENEDTITSPISDFVVKELDNCKYLNLLSKYVLKKHSISGQDLDRLLG